MGRFDSFDEAIVFLRFEVLPDPRQRDMVCYTIEEVLVLCPLAGVETSPISPGV